MTAQEHLQAAFLVKEAARGDQIAKFIQRMSNSGNESWRLNKIKDLDTPIFGGGSPSRMNPKDPLASLGVPKTVFGNRLGSGPFAKQTRKPPYFKSLRETLSIGLADSLYKTLGGSGYARNKNMYDEILNKRDHIANTVRSLKG